MKTFEMHSQELPRRIYGIDFSGAKDAGRKIWVAGGVIHNGILHIDKCDSAENILGEERLMPCLEKLQKFISLEKNCAFGFDFPFGVQKDIVQRFLGEGKWEDFIKYFYEEFSDPDKFKKACRRISDKSEWKRETDKITATPFSPYNIRVYKQTYYGIRNVPDSILDKVLKNNSGDALDSVIAAYATFCAWRNHFAVDNDEKYDIEGYVFA